VLLQGDASSIKLCRAAGAALPPEAHYDPACFTSAYHPQLSIGQRRNHRENRLPAPFLAIKHPGQSHQNFRCARRASHCAVAYSVAVLAKVSRVERDMVHYIQSHLICPIFWHMPVPSLPSSRIESPAVPVNAFLLLLCTEADTLERRFLEKIATQNED